MPICITKARKNVKKFLLLSLLIVSIHCVQGQAIDVSNYKKQYRLEIKKAKGVIKVDGLGEEQDWQIANVAADFWKKFPVDDEKAVHPTSVKVTYDNQMIYFLATVTDSTPLVAQSLKRDSRIRESDGFGIMLDPMNKKTNGFYFTVSAYNVQGDDQLSANSMGELNFSWDNKWFSATKIYADHYVVEVGIPFKTLRYDPTKMEWGINFIRSDKKRNEFDTWTRVPVNFRGQDLGYYGTLAWDATPPKAGSNIALIPYTTGGITQNKEEGSPTKGKFNGGFDAKVALNSSLNLDLTVNPDFSQVEVDQQVTNLSRFNIFFPERRNFFLENNDLFSEYGIPPIRPFYSRRIGLDPDGNTIPILGGVRLTGNVASRTRIGIMSMQTGGTENYASQNYSAFTMMQQVDKRSVFKTYFLNREGVEDASHRINNSMDKYGRNAGAEFAYNSPNGEWQAWAGYHHSMKEHIKKDNFYLDLGAGYFGRKFSSLFDFGNLGTNYYADMGFVSRVENYDAFNDTTIRLGFKQIFNETSYAIYPKEGKVNQHNFSINNFIVLNPNNTFNDWNTVLSYKMQFRNASALSFEINQQQTDLIYHTAFTDKDPLTPGLYKYQFGGISYESDSRKNFSFKSEFSLGKYFSADYQQWAGSLILRNQPWLSLTLMAQYNRLKFPEPFGRNDLFLLSSRVEWNFTNNLFWTTFIQYYTQGNNFNINSRLQWRYKPVSDLFLVYTDNYFVDPLFKNKNRAIIFKLNYWLNL